MISAKLTPPYSLINGIDFSDLGDRKEFQLSNGDPDTAKIDQKNLDG